jgi:hemolysin activation/secretion protein
VLLMSCGLGLGISDKAIANANILTTNPASSAPKARVCEAQTAQGKEPKANGVPFAIQFPGGTLPVRVVKARSSLISDLSHAEIQALLNDLVVERQSMVDGVFTEGDLARVVDDVPDALTNLYRKNGFLTVGVRLDPQRFSSDGHLLLELVDTPLGIQLGQAQQCLIFKNRTVFTAQEIEDAFKQSPSVEEVRSGVEKILDRLHLENGYVTTQTKVENNSGRLTVEVLEGSLNQISPKIMRNGIPDDALPSSLKSYIRSRVMLGVDVPLNQYKLESALRLLNSDPLFDSVEGILKKPGEPSNSEGPKKSDLDVQVVIPRSHWSGGITIDNLSPPSVGSVRMLADFRYISPLRYGRLGDDLNLSYYRSTTGGNEGLDLSYRSVLNPMNGTLLLRAAPSRNKITQREFRALEIRGKSQLYEVTYRQPLQRTFNDEFALSLGLTYQNGQTFLFDREPFPFGLGPDGEGVSRTTVLTFGQDYLRRYRSGVWLFNSQFRFGTGLLGATVNGREVPDGQFFSWLGQAQWVQRVVSNQTLITQVALQLTPDGLLPSQQCVIGGGRSVRGYRQNARSGDNCFRLSSEYQIVLGYRRTSRAQNRGDQRSTEVENGLMLDQDVSSNTVGRARDYPEYETKVMLAPFWDAGVVWNRSDNPNGLPPKHFLTSVGLGLVVEGRPVTEREARWSLRVDYGLPLIDTGGGGGDLQDAGVYLGFRYRL